ncbi:MAG: hypothetical protein KF906_02365 [Actinobacteria bacterium]|nr:hypothetical protein [Actinomycetota bacterium]
MPDARGLLDRGVPDVVDTDALSSRLAAEVDYLAGRTTRWTDDADVAPGIAARALVVADRHADARAALARVVAEGPLDAQDLVAAIWAMSRVGDPPGARVLAGALDGPDDPSGADGFVVVDDVPLAHRALLDGLLAVAAGDLTTADDRLTEAVAGGDARAPLWGALARVELARVRWTTADLLPSDDARRTAAIDDARRLALAARTFFVAGGYRHLVSTTADLFGEPRPSDRAEPRLGHLVEGSTWLVGFGAQPPVRVPATKGLLALRHVVEHRDRAVTAVELEVVLDGGDHRMLDHEALLAEVGAGDADVAALRSRLADPRARSRITKLLRRTIDRLGEDHAVLAAHLAGSVQTGYACRYRADPAVRWRT